MEPAEQAGNHAFPRIPACPGHPPGRRPHGPASEWDRHYEGSPPKTEDSLLFWKGDTLGIITRKVTSNIHSIQRIGQDQVSFFFLLVYNNLKNPITPINHHR